VEVSVVWDAFEPPKVQPIIACKMGNPTTTSLPRISWWQPKNHKIEEELKKRYLWNFKKVVGKFVFFYKIQYILGVMAWKSHIIWKTSNMQKFESHKKWKAKTQPNHQDNPLHMCLWVCLSTSWWHFCHDSRLVTYIYIYIYIYPIYISAMESKANHYKPAKSSICKNDWMKHYRTPTW